MSISLNVAGQTYTYPSTGDTQWGNQSSQWAAAVTASLLPKLGGTFLITGNIDFGAVSGLSATYFASNNNAIVAPSGFVRMANADKLTWISTNATDTYSLTVDSSDLLKFYFNSTPFRVACTDLTQAFTKGQAVTPFVVTSSGGTLALDMSQSNNYTCVLHENITTITPSNATDGQAIMIAFKQAVGSYTVTWPAAFTFIGTSSASPVVTTINTKISVLTGVYSSTFGTWLCTLASQP